LSARSGAWPPPLGSPPDSGTLHATSLSRGARPRSEVEPAGYSISAFAPGTASCSSVRTRSRSPSPTSPFTPPAVSPCRSAPTSRLRASNSCSRTVLRRSCWLRVPAMRRPRPRARFRRRSSGRPRTPPSPRAVPPTARPTSSLRPGRLVAARFADVATHLRYLELGSAALSPDDRRFLIETLPTTRICHHYGLTEASRAAFCELHRDGKQPTSLGRPAPNVEIRIADEQGRSLPAREVGEITVHGGMVMQGYWQQPELTRAALRDGWP